MNDGGEGGGGVTPQGKPYVDLIATPKLRLNATTQPSPNKAQLKLSIGTTQHHMAPTLQGSNQAVDYY